MNRHIDGFIAAPLTGFNPDGSLNLDVIPGYANMLHHNGIIGVFINGTIGEGAYLTTEERKLQAERWVDSVPDGMRVIVHVGYTSQTEGIALAEHAADIGAAGVGEIGPTVPKITDVENLVEYIATTAAASPDLPYYYYHMPSINNLYFSMIEFLVLARETIPNLSGIKYTHDDLPDYKKCVEFMDGHYDILFGRDEFLLDGLKAGAHGAVGSTYNIMVPLYHDLVKAFRSHDLEKARKLQAISADVCELIYKSGSFGSGLKVILRMIGLDLGGLRYPQKNLSPKEVQNLKSSLENSGVLKYFNKV
jgi:N-acetylneuraminate lyase